MFAPGTEPAWLAELNPAQRRAATFGEGPLLIVAGAGSGKTKTLACRVAHLLEEGVPPERLLLLTFTRRSARELLVRAEQLTGKNAPGRVWGGTFHSVGNRLLRMHGRLIGLPESFTVMDQGDSADLIDLVRLELGLGKQKRRFPRKDTLSSIYSRMVNAGRGYKGSWRDTSRGASRRSQGSDPYSAGMSSARESKAFSTTTISCCSGRR